MTVRVVPPPPPPPPPSGDAAESADSGRRLHRLLRPEVLGRDDLAGHLQRHGALPDLAPSTIIDAVDASGLLGRGGAGFPAGRKMRTVAAGSGRAVVVGNGCEGEPGSSKDAALLEQSPHLVLDGLQLAARAVGADQIHLAVHAGSSAMNVLRHALSERSRAGRSTRVQLHAVPARYVASEESALVQFLNGGPAKPTFTPPRPYEKGVAKRPTLVNNVETLANVALIARHGAAWFRAVGDRDQPGTQLVTVSGPGPAQRLVLEVETGRTVDAILAGAGVAYADCQAVLVGGYFGTWLTPAQAHRLPLTHDALRSVGGAVGAGIVIGLPHDRCGLAETSRVATYLAAQNAGQCGPCLNGLPAIAGALQRLAFGPWDERLAGPLARWLTVVPGRGACRHPDGAVRLIASALQVFARDVDAHRAGLSCAGVNVTAGRPFLPVPSAAAAQGPWR